MKPTLGFPNISPNSRRSSKRKPSRPQSHSRFAAFMFIFWSIFATMAAAATIAGGDLPLILGGM